MNDPKTPADEASCRALENVIRASPAPIPPELLRPGRTWMEETRLLMLNRPARIKLKEIAEACEVSIAWLSLLQTAQLPDASIVKVQRVNKWLRENAINVAV